MMLKDKQGRTVLIRWSGRWNGRQTVFEFLAREGISLEPVEEAIVSKGDDVFLNEDQVRDILTRDGFPGLAFSIDTKKGKYHNPLDVSFSSDYPRGYYSGFALAQKQEYRIEGKLVDKATYERLITVLSKINEFNGNISSSVMLQAGLGIDTQKALELIGVGNVVTTQSLLRGCAKGEERPRLLPGDSVKIAMKGKEETLGIIKSMKTTVTVLRQDGVKISCAFDRLTRTDEIGFNTSLADQTEVSIMENFNKTVENGKKRIFRAKLEKGDFTFPMFPDTDRWGNPERQITCEGAMSCVCPICGWRMADMHSSGEFICCYCRITGMVIASSDAEVSLLMSRMPGKNRFAIKEARCCGNCGRFEFDVGRQGKRSTGYCPTANQCLQAFNICELWYPREVKRYESNMRQHITNLHYGVKDTRNTSRNDIRETVYTEADHKNECDRADKAKVAYSNAYQRFMSDLIKAAKEVPLVEGMSPELTEEWKKVLDDPC